MPGMMGRGLGMPPNLPKPMGMMQPMGQGMMRPGGMPGLPPPMPRAVQRPPGPYQMGQPPMQQGFPLP